MVSGLFEKKEGTIYVNAASSGLMSIPAMKAAESILKEYTERAELTWDEQLEVVEDFRKAVSKLLDVKQEEVVPVQNTSQGTFIALLNVINSEEDEIILMEEAFPSIKYIAEVNFPMNKKIYVKFSRRNPVEAVKPHITNKTRAVVIDLVHYVTGEFWDTTELGGYLKEKGIYLIVDGIQGIGAIPFKPFSQHVHFLSCGGSKWLLGPGGTGFLWVSREVFPELKKVYSGWLGAPWKNFSDFSRLPQPYNDPRTFELGTRNLPGMAGLTENIKILNKIGIEQVNSHILSLKNSLLQKIKSLGYKSCCENSPSGIISIKHEAVNMKNLYECLKNRGVICSYRNGMIRFSPHIYNNLREIEKIIGVIKGVDKKGVF